MASPVHRQAGPTLPRRALAAACACNFILLASYYVLRPLRDTMATVSGAGALQQLYTYTFAGTLLLVPVFAALASRVRLTRLLPAMYWFWFANILAFHQLFLRGPATPALSVAYFVWFSVMNLFMVSVFWSLMSDLFTPAQATRCFGYISAAGSLGAIAGPLATRALAERLGVPGLLLLAAAGFLAVACTVHVLVREKERLLAAGAETQASSLAGRVAGGSLAGFGDLLRSPMLRQQALFVVLMTWATTVAYFLQTDIVARSFTALAGRTEALADIDLTVNVCSALLDVVGLRWLLQRFGVTAGLALTPVIMFASTLAMLAAPSLVALQVLQVTRRVTQYAIARPCRELCFTVTPQATRYKAKNLIDTGVYRLGDLSGAWLQALLRALGAGMRGSLVTALFACLAWLGAALALGRRYEAARSQLQRSSSG